MSGRTLTNAAALVEAGLLPEARRAAAEAVAETYAIAVTPAMAALIEHPDDPIGRQFLPDAAELASHPLERADPIGDHAHSPVPGIVHRYPDRVLLKALHVCPVYCRFCFRREMVGPDGDGTLDAAGLATALAYIADHAEIWEVILTGGDPLMLSPRRLKALSEGLAAIPHVKILRLHSRVPVVDPARIEPALVEALAASGKTVHVAIHANHPRELTAEAEAAIRRLRSAGIVLLSQTVLLRNVNDDLPTLEALMRRFVEWGIRPYYLHHPDLAPGTAHFRLSIAEGQALVAGLRGHVSGLCQPDYVLDIPGGHGKAPIAAPAIDAGPETTRVRDFRGVWHRYPPVADD